MPKIPPTSSSLSVSSGFGNQFLNLSYDTFLVGTTKEYAVTEINSLLDIQIQQEVPQIQSPNLLNVPVSVIPEQTIITPIPVLPTKTSLSTASPHASIVTTITSMLKHTTPIPTPPIINITPTVTTVKPDPLPAVIQRLLDLEKKFESWTKVDHMEAIKASVQANLINKKNPALIDQSSFPPASPTSKAPESLFELELKQILFDNMDKIISYMSHDKHQELFDAILNSIMLDEAIASGIVNPAKVLKKRDRRDDQDPTTGSDQGKNKRRKEKDSGPPKDDQGGSSKKGKPPAKTSKANKLIDANENITEQIQEVPMDTKEPSIDNVVSNAEDQPDAEAAPKTENALKNDCIELEYNMEECYKALSDKLDWINPEGDRCPYDLSMPLPWKLGMEVYRVNDKDKGYKILRVVRVKVDKKFVYGYLKEIVVRRADRQLYTFKEGDFINLYLNDIEDMLLLVKKLNITNPQRDFPIISAKETYTPSFDPQRVVYEDLSKQKRLMRADALYKFSDGTLKSVQDPLHHRLLNFRLGYNKGMARRKWTDTDQRRLGIMAKLIDEKMLERRIIQNLERLVGAKELAMDYRLMQRTI
ncbi:hypothetical protein Tco_1002949 [Tanacetum coccineum]|uniref:Uncharacterized protein n=1 Tax=Tanacetum coccineum TaxID=301880 RepID=A0ABQ5F7Q0_9ASTR